MSARQEARARMRYERSSAVGEDDTKPGIRDRKKDHTGDHIGRHPFKGFKWLEPVNHTLVKATCIEFLGEPSKKSA